MIDLTCTLISWTNLSLLPLFDSIAQSLLENADVSITVCLKNCCPDCSVLKNLCWHHWKLMKPVASHGQLLTAIHEKGDGSAAF
jgi:hypothetical protein